MKRLSIAFWLAANITAPAAFGQAGAPHRPASVKPPAASKASSAAPAALSYKDLKYPPLRAIEIPKIDTLTLPNGMRLYLLEDHELPRIQGTALVRTGNLFDPPEKVGLATATGIALRAGGTAAKTGEQLDEQLENVGAHVESEIGESSGSVTFFALKETAPSVMSVFHDLLTAPEFRQEKIDLAKSELDNAISHRNDDPHRILERTFSQILYGRDNSYAWDDEHSTVDRITRADVQNFYKRYFFPKNIMFAVWGDFDSAQMKAQVEKLFADWNVDQPAVPAFPKVTENIMAGTFLAVKRDVSQTFFSLGELGGVFSDKDYPALTIMANILGGGSHSRLAEQDRAKMANAPDVSAAWLANYDHPGMFKITGSAKLASTVETIEAVESEVERIRTSEVSDEELKAAKDTALNSLVFAYDTKAKTLGRLMTFEYFGYPRDFIQQYQKALEGVTRADVLRVAKEHLDPARFTLVAVANPNGFVEGLDKLGHQVIPIDLTIPEAKPAPADPVSLDEGRRLLAMAQHAVGGTVQLQTVKDYVETAQLDAVNPTIHIKKTYLWVAPNNFREEDELPGGLKAMLYTDGHNGWLAQGRQTNALLGAQAKHANGDMFRSYIGLLLSSETEDRTVNAIDVGTVEIFDKEGNRARLTLDPNTFMPRQLSYEAVSVTGQAPHVQEIYSDFRDVDGIKIPFKISLMSGGMPMGDLTVTDVKINTGVKPDALQKRP